MNTSITSRSLLLLAAGLSVLTIGCRAPRQAIHLDPAFDPRAVDQIAVVPVVDARFDKKLELNFDKWTRNRARRVLKSKRYQVTLADSLGSAAEPSEEQLQQPTPEFIKGAGPADARWVMIFSVHDVTRKLTFGSTGNAELSAVLFDKGNASVAWRDKAIGRAGQGGLLGMALIGLMSQSAVEQATYEVLKSLPKRPKK
jgi:hypothetical protein